MPSDWQTSHLDGILVIGMRFPRNYLKQPLDWVLAVSSHIGVIRALKDSREGMSGRAVARAAGFNHQSVREAIAKLELMGVVKRQGSGKTQLIRLNLDNTLVRDILLPMFDAERQAMARLRADIRKEFVGKAKSATVFGSVARQEEEPGSDIDLLLVAPHGLKEELLERAASLGRRTLAEYGLRVSPIVFTESELRHRARKKLPLLTNIISAGVDILDSRLGDIIG